MERRHDGNAVSDVMEKGGRNGTKDFVGITPEVMTCDNDCVRTVCLEVIAHQSCQRRKKFVIVCCVGSVMASVFDRDGVSREGSGTCCGREGHRTRGRAGKPPRPAAMYLP